MTHARHTDVIGLRWPQNGYIAKKLEIDFLNATHNFLYTYTWGKMHAV